MGDRVALAVHHGGDGGIDGHSHLLELGPRCSGNHVGQLAHGIDDVPRHLVMFLAQHVGHDLTDAFFGEAQRQGPDGVARDPDDAGDIPGGRLVLFQRGFSRNGIQKGHLFQDLQCAVQEGVDVFDVHIPCCSCCGSNPIAAAQPLLGFGLTMQFFSHWSPWDTADSKPSTVETGTCNEVSCVMRMKKASVFTVDDHAAVAGGAQDTKVTREKGRGESGKPQATRQARISVV